MTNILRILLLLVTCLSWGGCSGDKVSDEIMKENITARIIRPTCGGTVMQLIDAPFEGESWQYYAIKDGEFDQTGPFVPYENCVLAGNVPSERYGINDTLSFTYVNGLGSGMYCDLGGLPFLSISVETLKN